MTKQEFKCAFVFMFGMKANKEDIQIVKDFIQASSDDPNPEFALNLD